MFSHFVGFFVKIHGLNLTRIQTGVAGETGVGKIVKLDQPVNGLAVNDNVLVVGNSTWKTDGKFSDSSVFKIPILSPAQAVHLPSSLLAYGLLFKYNKLETGDTVIQGDKVTPISNAVTQIGKYYGFNVVSSSITNLENKDYIAKLKSQGKVKLGISSNSPKLLKAIYRAVGLKSSVAIYNDHIETIEEIDGLHLAVSKAVFEDVSVYGLNLSSWAKSDKDGFQKAINTVAKLISDKEINISNTQSFPYTDFLKAISAASEGKASVITF